MVDILYFVIIKKKKIRKVFYLKELSFFIIVYLKYIVGILVDK